LRLYTLFFYSAVTVLYWFINMNEKNIIIYIYKRPVCWVELCIQTAGQHIAIINGIHRSRNESAVDKIHGKQHWLGDIINYQAPGQNVQFPWISSRSEFWITG